MASVDLRVCWRDGASMRGGTVRYRKGSTRFMWYPLDFSAIDLTRPQAAEVDRQCEANFEARRAAWCELLRLRRYRIDSLEIYEAI